MDGVPATQLLDQLVGTAVSVLRGGYDRLSTDLHELMSDIIGIHLMLTSVAWLANSLQVFTGLLWSMIHVFLWAFLFVSYMFLTQAFIDYCVWAGLAIGGHTQGSQISVEDFQKPSMMIDKGFVAVTPIKQFINSHTGVRAMWNWFTLLIFLGVWFVVQTCFMFIGLYLTFAQLMLYVTTMFALPFLVFGAWSATSFLMERAAGLFIASAVRYGAAALVIGLISPWINAFFLPEAEAPGIPQAIGMAIGIIAIAGTVVLVPAIAHKAFAGGRLLSLGNLVPGGGMSRGLGRAA